MCGSEDVLVICALCQASGQLGAGAAARCCCCSCCGSGAEPGLSHRAEVRAEPCAQRCRHCSWAGVTAASCYSCTNQGSSAMEVPNQRVFQATSASLLHFWLKHGGLYKTNNKTKRIKTIKQKQRKQATNCRRKPQSNFLLQDILNFLLFFFLILGL